MVNIFSEAAIRDKPQKRLSIVIKDGTIGASKLSDGAIKEIASLASANVPPIKEEEIDAIVDGTGGADDTGSTGNTGDGGNGGNDGTAGVETPAHKDGNDGPLEDMGNEEG